MYIYIYNLLMIHQTPQETLHLCLVTGSRGGCFSGRQSGRQRHGRRSDRGAGDCGRRGGKAGSCQENPRTGRGSSVGYISYIYPQDHQ